MTRNGLIAALDIGSTKVCCVIAALQDDGSPRIAGIGHQLSRGMRGGAVVVSRNVRVDGTGEGVLAEPLEAIAKAHPDLSLGSYPFFGPGGYGSNLVIRGRDPAEVEATAAELVAALTALGVANITADEPGAPA